MVKLTNFDHLTTVILEFWPWSWSKTAIFDHLTTAIFKFWPWSWSKIFDYLTMTPGHRPNGQKIVVIINETKIYKIYKILKIICNIQVNVIQIAQVLSGYLLRTFDKIVSHE